MPRRHKSTRKLLSPKDSMQLRSLPKSLEEGGGAGSAIVEPETVWAVVPVDACTSSLTSADGSEVRVLTTAPHANGTAALARIFVAASPCVTPWTMATTPADPRAQVAILSLLMYQTTPAATTSIRPTLIIFCVLVLGVSTICELCSLETEAVKPLPGRCFVQSEQKTLRNRARCKEGGVETRRRRRCR
jgi:hypothetical protein